MLYESTQISLIVYPMNLKLEDATRISTPDRERAPDCFSAFQSHSKLQLPAGNLREGSRAAASALGSGRPAEHRWWPVHRDRGRRPCPTLETSRVHPLQPLVSQGRKHALEPAQEGSPLPAQAKERPQQTFGENSIYSLSKPYFTALETLFHMVTRGRNVVPFQHALWSGALPGFPHPPVCASQVALMRPSFLVCQLSPGCIYAPEHTSVPPTDPWFTCCKPRKELSLSQAKAFPRPKSSFS